MKVKALIVALILFFAAPLSYADEAVVEEEVSLSDACIYGALGESVTDWGHANIIQVHKFVLDRCGLVVIEEGVVEPGDEDDFIFGFVAEAFYGGFMNCAGLLRHEE